MDEDLTVMTISVGMAFLICGLFIAMFLGALEVMRQVLALGVMGIFTIAIVICAAGGLGIVIYKVAGKKVKM